MTPPSVPAGRDIASLVLRSAAVLAILGAVYVLVPSGSASGAWAIIIAAVIGLAGFTGVFIWQVGAIMRSPRPVLSAVIALVTIVGLFIMLFSLIYLSIQQLDPGAFSEPLSRLSAAYFTLTVLATVGFGDIVAKTDGARAVVMLQMFLGLGLVGTTIRLLSSAAQRARQRHQGDARG